jgi:pilus assembly protein CpaC
MNDINMKRFDKHFTALKLLAAWIIVMPAWSADKQIPIAPSTSQPVVTGAVSSDISPTTQAPVELLPAISLSGGKSMLLRLSEPALRIAIGNPDVVDVALINAQEVYVQG